MNQKTVDSFLSHVNLQANALVGPQYLAHGENVYLRGFGTFAVKERAQKTARNITKNTTIIIPAHKIPSFKPANEFKDSLK